MLSTICNRAITRAQSSCLRRAPTIASIPISRHDAIIDCVSPLTGAIHSTSTNNQVMLYSSLSTYTSNGQWYQRSLGRIYDTQKEVVGPIRNVKRTNFSYAGPRKLSDILKTELLEDKTAAEISDLWMTYHEGKEKVHGLTLDKARGKSILSRAAQCPFFIHPVFREEGHFMIISQFQSPNYFLLAFLEDYRLDPARAQPLLTISIFDDMADEKDVTLVRCDVINRGIEDDEGYKICKCLLDDYSQEEEFRNVHMFNKKPDAFDVDEFVKEKEQRWKENNIGDSNIG